MGMWCRLMCRYVTPNANVDDISPHSAIQTPLAWHENLTPVSGCFTTQLVKREPPYNNIFFIG